MKQIFPCLQNWQIYIYWDHGIVLINLENKLNKKLAFLVSKLVLILYIKYLKVGG